MLGASLVPGVIQAANHTEKFEWLQRMQQAGPNDQVQLALIGAGGMGNADTDTCITVPGVKLVAVCDLYDGRLDAAKKKFNNDLFVTRAFNEILSRKDIDAVIVATPDHWHKDISIAAMKAGKGVYCEKPMVHDITEGGAPLVSSIMQKDSGPEIPPGVPGSMIFLRMPRKKPSTGNAF